MLFQPIDGVPFVQTEQAIAAETTMPDLQIVGQDDSKALLHMKRPYHILVVHMQTEYTDMDFYLRQRGFRVWNAKSIAEARLTIEHKVPSAIVFDIGAPDISTIELIQTLRMHPVTRIVPIVILSDQSRPIDIRNGLAIGADEYLAKPIDLMILEARITALFRRERWLRKSILHIVSG